MAFAKNFEYSLPVTFHERNTRAEFSSNSIGEPSEVVARQIVLKISWIEMIGQIENL